MPRRRSLRVRVLAAMATYTLALKACWFTPITRSPAQNSACKDLGRNGQSPAITPKATYTPILNRASSRSQKNGPAVGFYPCDWPEFSVSKSRMDDCSSTRLCWHIQCDSLMDANRCLRGLHPSANRYPKKLPKKLFSCVCR